MTPWGGILRRNLQQYNYTNNIVRKQIIYIHKIPSMRSKEFSPGRDFKRETARWCHSLTADNPCRLMAFVISCHPLAHKPQTYSTARTVATKLICYVILQ